MNLRSLTLAVALALPALAAHAQGALYLNPTAIRISNSVADTGTFAFLGQNSKSQVFYGINFGGYYTVVKGEKLYAALDIRDSIVHGNNALLNSFLLGPRIAYRPSASKLQPYIEPVVGVGSSRAPNTAIHVSKAEYGVFAGVDWALSHHVDFRIFEVGYSSLQTASSETIGASASIPSAKLLTFSSALVFRIP